MQSLTCKKYPAFTMACLAAALGLAPLGLAQQNDTGLEEMIIIGIRDQRTGEGATGLNLSVYDTPQSVTVLDADTLGAFSLDDINSLLELATGINVDKVETDRTYYNARGFDITSMYVDGVGVPFNDLLIGALDTAIYDKVEIIRGANGLITGIGNPSGTINYVRKRPTNDLAVNTELSGGSWNKARFLLDASAPITNDGRWAARGVAVAEDRDSWLDHHSHNRRVYYGIVDGQIGEALTLAAGFSRQDSQSDGVLWGSLPIQYNNGAQADYDVSTTTAMDWTYWNVKTDTAFVELGYQFNENWSLISTITGNDYSEFSELFYVYLGATGLDPDTGLGIISSPGRYEAASESQQWDTQIDGAFSAFNQRHELSLGLSLAEKDAETLDYAALTGGNEDMPAFPGWLGNEVPRPQWDSPYMAHEESISLNRLYGVMRLSLSETVKLILGANLVEFEDRGFSWGVSTDSDESGSSPYVGFTWELADGLNIYASYSDIYRPQFAINQNFQPLGSAKGDSFEAGLKKYWLSQKLLTSFAVFKIEQDNLAEFVTYSDGDNIDDDDFSDDFDWALYQGIAVRSEGFELEAAGHISDNLKLQVGYTQLTLEDPDGNDNRTFIPRKTFKLLLQWQPQFTSGLEFGLSTRWQSEIYNDTALGRLKQDAYTIVGTYGSYEITDKIKLALTIDNLSDEKYFNSMQWDQSFYGAPRNVDFSVNWKL